MPSENFHPMEWLLLLQKQRNNNIMKRLLIIIGFIISSTLLNAQNCTLENVADYPGKWKPGMQGSINGVAPASLAKQKEIIANFVKRLQQNLMLKGFDIKYSGVYGYPNPALVKNRKTDAYELSMALITLYCENGKVQAPHETSFWINIRINKMPVEMGQSFFVQTTPYEEDLSTDKLGLIDSRPEKQNGIWVLKENFTGGFGKSLTRYKWIFSYNDELPFRYVAQKEVLNRLISYFEKKIRYTKIEMEIEYTKKLLVIATEYLANHTAEELNQPAIINGGITSIFSLYEDSRKSFYEETDPYTSWVVDNNPDYFKATLPLHTPQLITVDFTVDEKNEAVMNLMYKVIAALDANTLRSMLGNPDPFKNINMLKTATPIAASNQPAKTSSETTTTSTTTAITTTTAKKNEQPAAALKNNKQTTTATTTTSTKDTFDYRQPVYDLDSNRYSVLKIGKQYWLKENLRTTKYNDTTAIATGLSDSEWKQTTKGAYSIYESKTLYESIYGKLYNGFAVRTGKLCPKGWRVATDKDWNELELFLGIPTAELERTGERGNVADKLKAPNNWKASAFSANNSSGFSIEPAGARLDNGEFSTINQYGNFWTSTVYDDRYGLLYLWNHHTHYNTNAMGRIYTLANNGYSCRCIIDTFIVQKNTASTNKDNLPEKANSTPAIKRDSFDLALYNIPTSWKKENGNGNVNYSLVDSKTGEYAKIIIYKSIPGTNDIKKDFETEWNNLIAQPYNATQRPEILEENIQNGWMTKAGVSSFIFKNKESGVTLISGVNNANIISIVLLANTDRYKSDFKSFRQSIQFKNAPVVAANTNVPAANNNSNQNSNSGFTYTTSNFDDGWTSTVQNDYVLVEKGNQTVYLNFSVPYNASQFSGTGLRDAEYYWDNYVTQLFTVRTRQFNDGGSMALKPPYMEGYATDKRTGKTCFIGMYLLIVPNSASVVIGTAPDENTFRQNFPKANDPFGSDLAAMTRYNKFAIAVKDIAGKWQNGNTETAQWYYVSPSGYEGYAGMTLAATSATFSFNDNGSYTSIHNGATGAVGNMNTFQQEYKGNYTLTNWMITATNRFGGKTENFEASFTALRGGRILQLNNNAGQKYSLVKVK
jgi:uncharacterized protein (TIGR02145 family)